MADGQLVAQGRFTGDATAKDIVLRSDFDSFEVINYTQAATTQGTGRGVRYFWQRGMADNLGLFESKQNAANALDLEEISAGGFLRVDSSVQAPEAAKALSGTEITAANPAVVTATAHGYANGDRVRIINPTSMLQIGGYEFTIGSVATNDFELSYLDASGFAAAATGGSVRRIPNDPMYKPMKNWVTGMTAASAMVVTLSVTHGLAVDDVVRLSVPAGYGMVEADGLQGKVTAVSTANNTVTLDIDSSAFTAFAFPVSASAGSPALLMPFGSKSTNVDQALLNESEILMRLGAGPAGDGLDGPSGAASDVMYWKAYKASYVNNE
jgi:hypothetical protein